MINDCIVHPEITAHYRIPPKAQVLKKEGAPSRVSGCGVTLSPSAALTQRGRKTGGMAQPPPPKARGAVLPLRTLAG